MDLRYKLFFVFFQGLQIFLAIMGIFLSVYLYLYYRRNQNKSLQILFIPVAIMLSIIITNICIIEAGFNQYYDYAQIWASIGQIFLSSTLSLIVIFVIHFEGKDEILKSSLSLGFPFSLSLLFVMELYVKRPLLVNLSISNNLYIAEWYPPIGVMFGIQGILTGYWFLRGLKNIQDFIIAEGQEIQLDRMNRGAIIAFVVAPIIRITAIFLRVQFNDHMLSFYLIWIFGSGLISVGMFFVIGGYLFADQIEFLAPQKENALFKYMGYVFPETRNA